MMVLGTSYLGEDEQNGSKLFLLTWKERIAGQFHEDLSSKAKATIFLPSFPY